MPSYQSSDHSLTFHFPFIIFLSLFLTFSFAYFHASFPIPFTPAHFFFFSFLIASSIFSFLIFSVSPPHAFILLSLPLLLSVPSNRFMKCCLHSSTVTLSSIFTFFSLSFLIYFHISGSSFMFIIFSNSFRYFSSLSLHILLYLCFSIANSFLSIFPALYSLNFLFNSVLLSLRSLFHHFFLPDLYLCIFTLFSYCFPYFLHQFS